MTLNSILPCIYARVSTLPKKEIKIVDGKPVEVEVGQSIDPQLLELREYAARNGWNIVKEFTDVISGTKAKRDGLDAMLEAVKRKEVNVVLVVKLDRLGRSMTNMVWLMNHLEKNNCAVICTSQNIDTRTTSPMGKFIVNVMNAFAELDRAFIAERTIAGLANARANGVRLGRPSPNLVADYKPVVAQWKAEGGVGLRTLAKRLGGVSLDKAKKLAEAVEVLSEWE